MAPSLATEIGSRELSRIFRLLRDGVIPPDEYVLFRDMVTRATDESAPLRHTQWRIWRELVGRFHLFEIAPTQDWVRLIDRPDPQGIGATGCLIGIPCSDFTCANWVSDNPDVVLILRQAARPLLTAGGRARKNSLFRILGHFAP